MGTCKCCTGSGIQILFNGEKIYCKACGGTGKRIDLSPVPYIPVSPPFIPWPQPSPWYYGSGVTCRSSTSGDVDVKE